MAARTKNRALVYLRRSTERQEISLTTQLDWAIAEAARHSVTLDATQADLLRMQEGRLSSYKALRIDDGITGADLKRPGFLALINDAKEDKSISHLLINRRDRFARPENSLEMVKIEKDLRQRGITIVFAESVATPLERGDGNLASDLIMMFGYFESGEFLRKHSQRVLIAQRQLALSGYRVGGNAPYGFVRVLVDSSENVLEELTPGRHVRQPGCHIRITPKDEVKIGVWVTILELNSKGWGFKRIARYLNELEIPSPGAGRFRTDQGVRHQVSGRWGPNTVKELCENRAILGLQDYGRRSEGAHHRVGDDGYRLLNEADRDADDRPRVVKNDPSAQITASIGSAPRFEPSRWDQIETQRKARGKSQRGIPRANDPAKYPLSCRIIDLTDGCGSLMYGMTNGGRPGYLCGHYMRTANAECNHNLVDAEAVLSFTLKTLRQIVERGGNREKLRELIEQRARLEDADGQPGRGDLEIGQLEPKLYELRSQSATVRGRMARETDDDLYDALTIEFKKIEAEASDLERRIESLRRRNSRNSTPTSNDEIDAAMKLFENIERVSTDQNARGEINSMLSGLGIRLGLNFNEAIKGKTRRVRQLVGGVMAFGDAELPVPLHGARNAQEIEKQVSFEKDQKLRHEPKSGSEELAHHDVPVQICRSEQNKAGTDSSSIPASESAYDYARLLENQQKGISFTKDYRGERI